MTKRWTYSDASICTAGVMVCTACRKPITEGAFRYRKDDGKGYMTQHKACSLDDLEWKQIAKRQEEYAAYHERRKAALQVFINEFGAPYEELIDECMAARSVSSPDRASGQAKTTGGTFEMKPAALTIVLPDRDGGST